MIQMGGVFFYQNTGREIVLHIGGGNFLRTKNRAGITFVQKRCAEAVICHYRGNPKIQI